MEETLLDVRWGKEFSAEAESDTQGSENIAESDLHELQPFALANGGGRAAEASDDRSEVI